MERTLEIDDDVLAAAEELASRQGTSVDRIISDIGRKALVSTPKLTFSIADLPALPVRDTTPVTVDFINELRDRLGV